MASIIDFSAFSFSTEEIRSINELVFDEIVKSPELSRFHTIFPGIKYAKEVGFIGNGGPVLVKGGGCDPTPQEWSVGTRKITWEPTPVEVFLKQCYSDLEATAAVYSLKTGTAIADFTSTDYMAIVVDVLVEAIKKAIIRIAWFGDVDEDTVSQGGNVSDSADPAFITVLDGFFKQAQAVVAGDAARVVTISENAGATYADQKVSALNAFGYLMALVYGAKPALRGARDGIILATQGLYDAYAQNLQGVHGLYTESVLKNLADGVASLTVNGVPVYPMPIWDELIAEFFDNGTSLYLPNRAIYTTKGALGIGTDGNGSFDDLSVWYERKERSVYIDFMAKIDAKLTNPNLVQLAI